MSERFIEGLETRQFLSGNPGGGDGPNGPNGTGPNGTGDQTQLHQQLRIHDASCLPASAQTVYGGDKLQIRARDGSCV